MITRKAYDERSADIRKELGGMTWRPVERNT